MPIFSAGSASVSIVPDFSGAQKAIGEFFARQSDIHVKVKPDLDNADVFRTEAELNAMHGTAKVEIDRNVLASSIAAGITSAMSLSGLDRLGGMLTAAIGPTVVGAIGGAFVELAAAASQAVGAVALLPAGLLAIAAPAATLLVGFQGVGKAIGSAFDPSKATQFQAAMDKLAPSAQAFVTQIAALGPAFTALRLDVQQQLFAGLGAAVGNLASVALPVTRAGMSQLAATMNTELRAVINQLSQDTTQFTTIWSNINAAFSAGAGILPNLVQSFVTLGAVGSQFLPQIAAALADVIAKFAAWTQEAAKTGLLVTIIQNAITVLTQLGQIAGNVASVVVGVFTAALPGGRLLLEMLVQVTGGLATFVHSADGQTALKTFFDNISAAIGIVLPALSNLVQALVTAVLPQIGELARILAPIAATLLNQLADGLRLVGGILPSVAKTVGDLFSAFAPLIPVIVRLITTLLPPLVDFFDRLAPIIGRVSAVIGDTLVAAAQAIAPILPKIADAFLNILKAVEPLLPQLSKLVIDLFPPLAKLITDIVSAITPLVPYLVQIVQQLLPPLQAIVKALIPLVGDFVQALGPILKIFLSIVDATVLPFIVTLLNGFAAGLRVLSPILAPLAGIVAGIVVAVKLWTIAQGLLDIALDANPIGLVVLAIAGLVTAIGLIITHLGFFKDVFTTVVDWVVEHWKLVVAAIPAIGPIILLVIEVIKNFGAIWQTVLTAIETAWNAFQSFFVNAWNSFTAGWTNFWNSVFAFFQNVWNSLAAWAINAWNAFTAGWTNFWNSVFAFFQTLWNNLVSWFENLWTALAGWFQNAWNAYTTAWSNFWNAVFSFFQNLWNNLVSWFENLWTALAGWFQQAWAAFSAAWSNFWNAAFSFFQNLWNTLVSWVENLWTALAGWLQQAWNSFTAAWQNFWNGVFSFFQSLWNNLVSWVQSVWNTLAGWFSAALNTFSTVWQNVWNGVSSTFQNIWNGIKSFAQQVWNDIKAIIAAPINFVIGTILNGGLFKAWNAVNDFLGLPWHINDLPTIPGFAGGGYTGDYGLFGTGDREDPAGVVHAKEFVFTANQVQAAGGPDAMYGLASQLDSGYAMGGMVRQAADDPNLYLGSYIVPPSIAPRIRHFLDALSVGQAEAVQAAGGFDAVGPGFFWGGYADPMSAAKAVAASMNGKPYIWGGAGPGGADCSGYMSIIANALEGQDNPFFRLGTTETMPWGGFVPGLTSAFAIGNHRDPNGHMAGTLGGVNVESGGSHGNVAYGGPAVGALDSYFSEHYSLQQIGGQFVSGGAGGSGGNPVMNFFGNILSSVGDVLSFLKNSITGGVKSLLDMGGGKFTHILSGLPDKLIGGMWDKIKDKIVSFFASTIVGGNTLESGTGRVQDDVKAVANGRGWGTGAEWSAIDYIVSHESGWNPHAQNPSSTASGLFQQIDSTWAANRPASAAAFAHMKDASNADQASAGLRYISSAYGDPVGAQQFWAANHWYDQGGWLPPGWSSVYNGTGGFEAVLNQSQQDSITSALSSRGGGGTPAVHVYIGDQEITDMIDTRVIYHSNRDGRAIRSGM